MSLNQCNRYQACTTCMNDPYCGWNIKKNVCEDVNSNRNLVTLNQNMCSRIQRQENIKSIQLDSGAYAQLECNINDSYLFEFIEWKKDQQPIDFNSDLNKNIFLTWNKSKLLILRCMLNLVFNKIFSFFKIF
jgi:hypothetical protein